MVFLGNDLVCQQGLNSFVVRFRFFEVCFRFPVLRLNVPLRDVSRCEKKKPLPLFDQRPGNEYDNTVYSTKELNGQLLSYGKTLGGNSSLLPVYFFLTNNGSLIPGQAVEVYLKSRPIENALILPLSALIEEQGNFFVYAQVAGESFDKREVETGAQDGVSVQIISGLNPGERIVTKGGYLVKLATQSGSVPAHGHEH